MINGETHYLWRAMDHNGEILESYVTRSRDKKAALDFMQKALKRHGSPERVTTDGLKSYRAAMKGRGSSERQDNRKTFKERRSAALAEWQILAS